MVYLSIKKNKVSNKTEEESKKTLHLNLHAGIGWKQKDELTVSGFDLNACFSRSAFSHMKFPITVNTYVVSLPLSVPLTQQNLAIGIFIIFAH